MLPCQGGALYVSLLHLTNPQNILKTYLQQFDDSLYVFLQ